MIKGCIFDLGGTIVDKYSLTPLLSFKQIFINRGITVYHKMITKDMGKNKLNHIESILNEPYIKNQWIHIYNNKPNNSDIDELYNEFKIIQCENTIKYMGILPATKSTIDLLQNKYKIKVGITTGFDKETTDNVITKLLKNDIYVDSYVSSTCLDKPGRPEPYMIEENMKRLKIDNSNEIIKVDDTNVGIEEGLNAKCWTVGVAEWSINMDVECFGELDELEYNHVLKNHKLKNQKLKESRLQLEKSNPHFIIDSLYKLPQIINNINKLNIKYM